ncbi:double-strand break repair helicase AddA [Methylocystis parvus]|uniref:DNA 3'-5' helicase n=1 Tax=Methylocystis parvus TaxID=134 RepID=A0A6B8LXG5_9HYPH|nr:double-strand break repair helicase AddA [Methylocystis parvus]QGM96144.1 double-strand break repair helicase AddA [Methylocystis parvus]WBK00035.1 double-strand break repair helicase AddA [Methylocystis parvus OBBP]
MNDRAFLSMTIRAQQRASDPHVSAWVAAHAGSGKTYVLTQRVLRLLLEGVRPSQILCLTFTKAAAANMSTRVFDKLAQWALLDDDALTREIEGTGAQAPSRADLAFARRLFARAVETPGGLKIQTIHAFCEKLLHIFPFEANAPAGFEVVDDAARSELLRAAKSRAIVEAMRASGSLNEALRLVARETTESGFDDLCGELLTHRDALAQAFEQDEYARRLRRRLGLGADETLATVDEQIMADAAEWPELVAILRQGSRNDQKLAATLQEAAALSPGSDRVNRYISVFYTNEGKPRGSAKQKIVTAGMEKISPGILARMEAERDRLARLVDKRKAASVVERSLALASIGDAIIAEYERAKRYRNYLDYDDLIDCARRLLHRSNPSWVLYKLDAQIDHILLDEAQDTSARQWDILTAIAKEFCAGVGARRVKRSFFAVGDDKQSIFSFQGAAPEKFDSMRRSFQASFAAISQRFEYVRLVESFRSAPGVLAAVDDVFNFGDNGVGLSCDLDPAKPPLKHEAAKSHVAASIEIWSPIGPLGKEEPEDWRLPLDYASAKDPAERLARSVAAKISALLAPGGGECVEDNKTLRPVEPRDILIVVRKRGAFFEAVIRALKAENVPVAGADRLDLARHIAVNDLVALGRASLLPEDDLTVATVLKSPLMGFDDDDLLRLSAHRPGSLYAALRPSAEAKDRMAALMFDAWRRDAATTPPYEFYNSVLGPGGGRRRLVARLGPEANDAIDEFLRLALSFEREQSPSLVAFLAMIGTLELSIKRDMEAAGETVRVMTAHAAKGLEAKIVFLPDTCGAPAGKHDPKLLTLDDGAGGQSLVWARGRDYDPAAVIEARDERREAERAEHRRLLYVAMTRAEERLYVSGHHGAKGPAEGCWHNMIVEALGASCERLPNPDDPEGYILRRGEAPRRADVSRAAAQPCETSTPTFARMPAPREAAPTPPMRPSSALAGADAFDRSGGSAPMRKDVERALVGRLTHALLQHLPQCAPGRRVEAAALFLERRGPGLDDARRAEILRAALSVIDAPELAPLFGPHSAAEVDIVATLAGGHAISGRIDRLAETSDEVLLADFKTGRRRDIPHLAQLRQLALYRAALAPLYPGKPIRCAIVWTQDASVVEAEDVMLDKALVAALEAAPLSDQSESK